MLETEVIIPCRLSYAFIVEPRKNDDGTPDKYSCALLIDKNDGTTVKKIKAAIEAAKNADKDGARKLVNNKGIIPSDIRLPLRDGDDVGKTEYEDCWFITASNKDKPPVYDRRANAIEPEDLARAVYSGCYANVKVNFRAYNFNGNKGITAYLEGIQKVKDGKRFGGGLATADDFEVLDDDDSDVEDIF